jgi:hypothetical protein
MSIRSVLAHMAKRLLHFDMTDVQLALLRNETLDMQGGVMDCALEYVHYHTSSSLAKVPISNQVVPWPHS